MGTIGIESFQMSTNVWGLLCEGVMIWVPLDLSHRELSNDRVPI